MIFKALKLGEIVDIISPATASSISEIEKIKKIVSEIGLVSRIFLEKELTLKKPSSCGLPAFSEEIRFEQLREAIENSESKIIWCARGGYGSAELLPFLEKMKKPKQQKIFIGFSDISSLNSFFVERWNWQVISAPVLIQMALNLVSEKSKKAISDLIFGKKSELKYSLKLLNQKTFQPIETKIVGGCISVLAGHFGTKNQINWDRKILFLEDEGEDGERLDRYFYNLTKIISEQKKYPQAILLGNFLEANPYGTPQAKIVNLAIAKFAKNLQKNELKIPLFEEKTKCLGHSKNMMPLILGASTKITADLSLLQKISLYSFDI